MSSFNVLVLLLSYSQIINILGNTSAVYTYTYIQNIFLNDGMEYDANEEIEEHSKHIL